MAEVGVEKSDCQFPRNYLVVLLDIALRYIISRINRVNEKQVKKEIPYFSIDNARVIYTKKV